VFEAAEGGARATRAIGCDASPSRDGGNLIWGPGALRLRRSGQVTQERLFGLIIERKGRFKFVSCTNKL
jgi:hypothetical protein